MMSELFTQNNETKMKHSCKVVDRPSSRSLSRNRYSNSQLPATIVVGNFFSSNSRIPLVSSSPTNFRRSNSLRVRGEKEKEIRTNIINTTTNTINKSLSSGFNKTELLNRHQQQNMDTIIKVVNKSYENSPKNVPKSGSELKNLPIFDENKFSPTICVGETMEKFEFSHEKDTILNKTDIKSNITTDNSSNKINQKDHLDSGDSILKNGCDSMKKNYNDLNDSDVANCDYKSINGGIIGQQFSPISEEGSSIATEVPTAATTPQQENVVLKSKRDTHGMTLNLNETLTKSGNSSSTKSDRLQQTSNQQNSTKARTPQTPKTPQKPSTSNVQPSKLTPKTPPVTPDSYNLYDDDLDSVYSFSSGRSTMSCDHPYVARNGTTFSGRKMKYVVHCSTHAGQIGTDYLTPTQRAQRQLRRLKELLTQARQDLEKKDSEILRLTREVVELRLFKASLSSPEDKSNSSDAVTVRENPTDLKTSHDVSPIANDLVDEGGKLSPKHMVNVHHQQHGLNQIHYLQDKMSNSSNSFADSGHFEDMTTASSLPNRSCSASSCVKEEQQDQQSYDEQRAELIRMYEKRIGELLKTHDSHTNDLKETHNDRIEKLLQKLAECNTRYADIVPDHEAAKERIRELEKQLEDLQHKLSDHEEKQNKMYLHMYQKNQEVVKVTRAEQLVEMVHRQPNRVSISDLLQQLQNTQDELENIRASNCRENGSECPLLTAKEAISLWVLGARKTIYRRLSEAQANKSKVDPEVTLQFLKSAIYYFLTDKENSPGHLKAIESILDFSEQEKLNIRKARSSK